MRCVQARINLIIGRGLTARAREALDLPVTDMFRLPEEPKASDAGFTLAQKMVGRACGCPKARVFVLGLTASQK